MKYATVQALPALARYVTVGAAATVTHYVLLVVAVSAFGADPVAAAGVASIVGALVSYAGNRGFTFASTAAHRQALPRFAAITVGVAALNAALVHLGIHWGAGYLQAQAVATVLIVFLSFVLHRHWTFS